ncbi:MAG: LysE family translocator [Alphaproteobacteria bacterium]|nr:LysE family translocator [Alphaproteobacteria bacterium]
MEPARWLAIAALCASGAVTPGPSLAVVVRNTVAGGRSRGMATGLGHGIGVGLYAFGAVAGFSALVTTVPGLRRALALAGGLFLVYLGVRSLMASGGGGEEEVQGRGFREGFLTAFLNPKIAVFFLALLGSFVPDGSTLGTRAGIAALAMVIDASWYVFAAAALVGVGGDRWLAERGRVVEVLTGVLLVVVGIAVVVT